MTNYFRAACCAMMLALAGPSTPPAALASGRHCPPAPCYEWVLTHECRRVAYRTCETRIDECGRSYTVNVVRYRTVQVPVWRYVRVR